MTKCMLFVLLYLKYFKFIFIQFYAETSSTADTHIYKQYKRWLFLQRLAKALVRLKFKGENTFQGPQPLLKL